MRIIDGGKVVMSIDEYSDLNDESLRFLYLQLHGVKKWSGFEVAMIAYRANRH